MNGTTRTLPRLDIVWRCVRVTYRVPGPPPAPPCHLTWRIAHHRSTPASSAITLRQQSPRRSPDPTGAMVTILVAGAACRAPAGGRYRLPRPRKARRRHASTIRWKLRSNARTERRGPKTAQGVRERRPAGPRRPPVVLRQSHRRILSAHFRRHSDTGRLTAWPTVRDIAHRSASVLRVSDHLALTLARSIRAERARAGLSQAQLAHRLGWSQQVQASIETGGRRLYAHELPDICRALGVPLATLLIGASPEDLEALGV